MNKKSTTRSSRQRWMRFSLRSLLLLVTVVCVLLGMHMQHVRTQRDVVAKLKALDVAFFSGVYGYDQSFATWPLMQNEPWWKVWLVEHFGIDHFSSIVIARLSPDDIDNGVPGHLERIVDQLKRLPRLHTLYVRESYPIRFSPNVFRQIARLKQIESLDIRYGSVTGEWMEPLVVMPRLRSLHFSETGELQDSAYKAMAAIKSLRSVAVPSYSKPQKELLMRLRSDIELRLHYDYAP